MSICKLGKYKKYFEVHQIEIQAKPILEEKKYYSGTNFLHFA